MLLPLLRRPGLRMVGHGVGLRRASAKEMLGADAALDMQSKIMAHLEEAPPAGAGGGGLSLGGVVSTALVSILAVLGGLFLQWGYGVMKKKK
eukprot:COSAG01_NODE_188_length_22632_cov_15.284915_14_plen_92_part_00